VKKNKWCFIRSLSPRPGEKSNLEVICLCVVGLLTAVIATGNARSHLAKAAAWVPDGLFAREPQEEGKPRFAPRTLPRKCLPRDSQKKIENWSKMGKMYLKSLGGGWVEFVSQNPRLVSCSGKGKPGFGSWSAVPHSNK